MGFSVESERERGGERWAESAIRGNERMKTDLREIEKIKHRDYEQRFPPFLGKCKLIEMKRSQAR